MKRVIHLVLGVLLSVGLSYAAVKSPGVGSGGALPPGTTIPANQVTAGTFPGGVILSGVGTGVFNAVTQYQADPTGGVDTHTQINNAITAASVSGGTVYLPAGTFYVNMSSGFIQPKSNVTIQGAGRGQTIIICDDTQAGTPAAQCLRNGSAGSAITHFYLKGVTLQGMGATAISTGSGLMLIYYCTECGVEDSEALYSRGFSLGFFQSNEISMLRNRVFNSLSDSIPVWDTPNAIVSNNKILGSNDDSISMHSSDALAAPVRSGLIIADNVIEESSGIKSLGAKSLSIHGNILRRIMGVGIYVDNQASFSQGDTPIIGVSITGNVITDVFFRQDSFNTGVGDYIIVSGGPKNALIPTFGTSTTPGDLYANGTNSGSPTTSGGGWTNITGNILMRTLPPTTLYASWGYSAGLWDGPYNGGAGGYYTGAIPEAALHANGIYIDGPIRNLTISDNTIATTASCFFFNAAANAMDYDNVVISGGTCSDVGSTGAVAEASGSLTAQRIVIQGVSFDGDPRFVHANRGSNGTWSTNGTPYAIDLPFMNGVTFEHNSVRDFSNAINKGSAVWNVTDNLMYGNPLGNNSGYSATNVGNGTFYSSQGWSIATTDDNPNSGTYGQTLAALLQNGLFNNLATTGSASFGAGATVSAGNFSVSAGTISGNNIAVTAANVPAVGWNKCGTNLLCGYTASTQIVQGDATGHWRFGGSGTPTIASGACGASTNGTLASGSNDHGGEVIIGAAATTTCTIAFASTPGTVPRTIHLTPGNAAAIGATVLPYVSSLTTGGFVITGSVLANTSFYYWVE